MELNSLKINDKTLNKLISSVPFIVDWLCNATDHGADALLQSYETDSANAEKALKAIVSAAGSADGDLSLAQIQHIGQRFEVSVWAKTLALIMTRSTPRLVPTEIGSAMISTLPQLHGATSVKEVCHILGPVLDQLPRKNFIALGTFSAMVRDTATNPQRVSMLVGPQILMPLISLQDEYAKSGSVLAAAALVDLLVQEAESLFGRIAGKRVQYPYGISRQVEPAVVSFDSFHNNPALVKRTLRAFYDWRDVVPVDQVDKLFELHKFEIIALFLFDKYGMLPPGWQEALVDKGITDLGQIDVSSAIGTSVKQEADLVIDEVASSEESYNKKLNSYIEYYAKPLIEIASGARGDAEMEGLGLTMQEAVDITGGQNLIKIRDTSNQLLAKLDMITLIKTMPISLDGRISQVLAAFSEILDSFECYIPYITRYNEALSAIDQAKRRIEVPDKSRQKKKAKTRDFMEFWEVVSNSHPRLNGQSLESILIEPIQRPPRYLLLFKQIRKQCDEKHPNLPAIEDMMRKLEEFNERIDRTLGQQEKRKAKLKNVLGIDMLPPPTKNFY